MASPQPALCHSLAQTVVAMLPHRQLAQSRLQTLLQGPRPSFQL
jgi:hypothetical protein